MIIVMHLHRGEHGIVAMRCLGAELTAEVEFLVHPKMHPLQMDVYIGGQ